MKELIERMARFNTGEVVHRIINENRDVLVQLQKEQLAAGIDIDGKRRIDTYALSTIRYKQRYGVGIGALTDRVTFFDKGDLYRSMFAYVTKEYYEVRSMLATFDKMLERVGDDKYGLDSVSRRKFAEEILLPNFLQEFHDKVL